MIKLQSDYIKVTNEEYFEFTEEFLENDKKYWVNCQGHGNRNANFNNKLLPLLSKNAYVVDIGCGHGECIEDLHNMGLNAIGIDGCGLYEMYSPAWLKYPEIFFQCDLGKPFLLEENGSVVKFDCLMSWECFEHVREADIDQLIINIDNHIKEGSIFICSIGQTNEPVHRTLKSREWWLAKFHSIGLREKDLGFGEDKIRYCPSDYFYMVKE